MNRNEKYVDTRGMEKMKEFFEHGSDLHHIWNQMVDYFLENRDEALFYISNISTVGFDPTENNVRNEEYLYYAKIAFGEHKDFSDRKYLMMWDYITTMQFYYVEKIIQGYLENDDASCEMIYEIVFGGINNM